MTGRDALVLGRVSNLPTVWSNTLAGWALAGGPAAMPVPAALPPLAMLLAALSLLYVGGMYLNDAFDRETDRRERPERPIPAGRVRAATVFAAGFAMIGGGLVLILGFAAADVLPDAARPGPLILSAVLLAGAVVLYDRHHKGNPLAPLLMGLCRGLVYTTAAFAFAPPAAVPALAALALAAYVAGLTYAAKDEALGRIGRAWPLLLLAVPFVYAVPAAVAGVTGAILFIGFGVAVGLALHRLRRRAPGDIGRAIAGLIAAISLIDALVIVGEGFPMLALVAAAMVPLTLLLQRRVPAT